MNHDWFIVSTRAVVAYAECMYIQFTGTPYVVNLSRGNKCFTDSLSLSVNRLTKLTNRFSVDSLGRISKINIKLSKTFHEIKVKRLLDIKEICVV